MWCPHQRHVPRLDRRRDGDQVPIGAPGKHHLRNTPRPLRHGATAEEVAYAALYLASDENSYTTCQWLSPNGGLVTV